MQTFWKEVKFVAFLSILSILVGYFLLVLVNLIPVSKIEYNVQKSAEIMFNQGNAPMVGGVTVENFSDADAIAIAYNKDDNRPFYYAMYAFNYSLGYFKNNRGVYALMATVDGSHRDLGVYEHSQEWHGYQLWLRPLLTFWDVEKIRSIFCILVNLSAILFCIYLVRVTKTPLPFFPFVFAFLAFNYVFASLSFLLATDILIAVLGCIGVVYFHKKNVALNMMCRLFLIIGMIASYFSMCNMPMLTIGFPLVAWLLIEDNKISANFLNNVKCVVALSLSWLLGYSIMTFSKLYLAKFLIGAKNGVYALKYYTGGVDNLSFVHKIYYANSLFEEIPNGLFLLLFVICVCLVISVYAFVIKKVKISYCLHAIPYLIVALCPYVWCLVMPITVRIWWTYLLYGISVFACLQFAWNLLYQVLLKESESD